MNTPLLTVCDVSKKYQESNAKDAPVLLGISFGLNRSETVAVSGPSGCGKSTLLNIIGTLDEPSSGTILFDGQNMADWNEARKVKFRNSEVGIVFQDHHLLPQFTVLENVLIPCLKVSASEEKRGRKLLEQVGLKDRENFFPSEISGGERQRAAVVRALINQPKLILADEPTGSLDAHHAEEVIKMLLRLAQLENVALITVTHNPAIADMMSRKLVLENGQLQESA